MTPRVKEATRSYDSSRRKETAEQTRHAIERAALILFLERGYGATTMPAIADAAGVALDTVYASIGPKPRLFRRLVEMAISGADRPITAQERDYVRAMKAEPDAGRKLELYAAAMRDISARMAPLFNVLREAAPAHVELRALWHDITERRARNMRLFAADLQATGRLREGISVGEAADVIWAMNSTEMYLLLTGQRRWSPDRYALWLADTWKRLLLV